MNEQQAIETIKAELAQIANDATTKINQVQTMAVDINDFETVAFLVDRARDMQRGPGGDRVNTEPIVTDQQAQDYAHRLQTLSGVERPGADEEREAIWAALEEGSYRICEGCGQAFSPKHESDDVCFPCWLDVQ